MASIALSLPDKKCALKEMPPFFMDEVKRLYATGQNGILDEMKDTVARLKFHKERVGTRQSERDYLRDLTHFFETVYGKNIKLDASVQVDVKQEINVMVKHVVEILEEMKVDTIEFYNKLQSKYPKLVTVESNDSRN